MAITLDPLEKIVQLDAFTVRTEQIWSAIADWAVQSDNLKYGPPASTLGGVPPVAFYLTLLDDWLVRPLEADGRTKIIGILQTLGGTSPIANTLGDFNSVVEFETPAQAVLVDANSGGDNTTVLNALDVVNKGVKKASILVPHTEDL